MVAKISLQGTGLDLSLLRMENILGPDTAVWEANPIGYFGMNLDHLNHDVRSVYGQEVVEEMVYRTPIMAVGRLTL